MTESTTYRIDKKTKKDAYDVFKQLGLKPSQAINLFLKQVAMRGGIPFEIMARHPNTETIEAFKESEQSDKLGSFESFDEIRKK